MGPSKDLNFKFYEVFCRAVEEFTHGMESTDPAVFKYRGANLKYAIERNLYFDFINNKRLFDCFSRASIDHSKINSRMFTLLERDFSRYLSQKAGTPKNKGLFFLRIIHIEYFLPKLRNFVWRLAYLLLPKNPKINNVNFDVLFYVANNRFAKYIEPIIKSFPLSYAFLIDRSNIKLKAYLKRKNLLFIDSRKLQLRLDKAIWKLKYTEFLHLKFWFDQLFNSLAQLNPKCVFVVEGNAQQDELMNQACKQLSIPIICLQHGWSPIIHNGFRNMSYTKMLTWGDGFSKLLQSYNPAQKFIEVGNHIIKFKAGNSKNDSDRKAICFFLQMTTRLISKECWNEYLKLIEWVAREFSNLPVIIREHAVAPLPEGKRNDLKKIPNIFFKSGQEYPLINVLDECFLTVSICSSTILESIAAGVLPIIFNMTSMPKFFPDIEAAGAGLEVKSPKEAQEAITRYLTDKNYRKQFEPGMRSFQGKYFYKNDGKAAERITQEIVSIIKA